MITFESIRNRRKPDFSQLLKVLERKQPDRATLFEFIMDGSLYEQLAGRRNPGTGDLLKWGKWMIDAFQAAGYDYAVVNPRLFVFPKGNRHSDASISLNEGSMIQDRRSFDAYPWPEPDDIDYSFFNKISTVIPQGMKIILSSGTGGILENVISLVGFDNLCYMLYEDSELAGDIFEAVGMRMERHYIHLLEYGVVGAIIGNDDWGHKSQTMFSPALMRQYVFPWHRKIVEAAHRAGHPAILHSCGNLREVMDDVIAIGYDAKHSFEDAIQPVEEAYDQYGSLIAIFGGIDLDFICRSTPDEVFARSRAMLDKTRCTGYALGSGNSIPGYVPHENYLAMIGAAIL